MTNPKARPSRRAKPQKDNTNQGHAVPAVTFAQPEPDKLQAVAATLKRNLESIPMLHWQEPIMSALQSAFMLGQAAEPESIEDRALDTASKEPEEIGYDFLNALARQLGEAAKKTGLSPSDMKLKWGTVGMGHGQHALTAFITMPMTCALTLTKDD
jgi:hypothetical protein